MTEIGIGISLYALVMDLVALFNIKYHLQGVLFNTASADLESLHFSFGANGDPNMLPLSSTIPAAKSIMNPLDKKNHDCVGFTLFGGVGYQSLEGFPITMTAGWKEHKVPVQMYCQYYATGKGIAPGDERSHAPLRDVCYLDRVIGAMVDEFSNPN